MIRTSNHTLKYLNKGKLEDLRKFISDYKLMLNKFINMLWNEKKELKFLDSVLCNSIKTNRINDSRIRQCAGKQACSIVNSQLSKHNRRLYKNKQLKNSNKYLQRKISLNPLIKPKLDNISIELDSRFVDIVKTDNHFDLFIQLSSIGNKEKIRIPIKLTKVSQKWLSQGEMLKSIRIKNNSINLYFEVKNKINHGTKTLGADQGQITCLALSDGQMTQCNKDGYDLNKIQDVLTRRKKGSKRFKQAQEHRKNYVNWSINQLNFDNVKQVKLEKIRNIRKGTNASRKSSHWTYTLIKSKLINISEEKGFGFIENENKFMSQRCSSCGFTHKSNRFGKTFKCKHCEFMTDSDLNAASNHEVELYELPIWVWHQSINRKSGFFWFEDKFLLVTSL